MTEFEKEYWLWLAQRVGLSKREKKVLLLRFGSAKNIYLADAQALTAMGLSEKAMASFLDKSVAEAVKVLITCRSLGIGVLTYGDANYPEKLRQIGDSPLVLYYLGTLPDWDSFVGVGVVGTRKATAHALQTAKAMAFGLCQGGAGVVSGMAAGIDACATDGALDAGGIAVGVLGCGIDIEYPASNHRLYQRMRQQGCLLSEYAPGVRAQQWTFPERNRIISGLSHATLVVEAPARSGALITARDARQQGKLLFAVPGEPGYITCAGSNELLLSGALPARKAEDILAHLPLAAKKPIDKAAAMPYHVADELGAPQTRSILDVLQAGPLTVDEIIAASGLSSSQTLRELTFLELQGQIYRPDPTRLAIKQ